MRFAVNIERPSFALVMLAAFLLGMLVGCRPPQPFVYPPPSPSLDLSKCPARRAVWFVGSSWTFHGITYPADSTLSRDSVIDVGRCR